MNSLFFTFLSQTLICHFSPTFEKGDFTKMPFWTFDHIELITAFLLSKNQNLKNMIFFVSYNV